MKKFIALLFVCILLCGCNEIAGNESDTSVQEPTALEAIRLNLKEENKLFAVLFAGAFPTDEEAREYVSDTDNFPDYPFVANIPPQHFLSVSEGWEVFLIIPAEGISVSVNRWSFEETSDWNGVTGDRLYQSSSGEPFFVKCNVSDIVPDSIITFSDGDTEYSWQPTISLKDGTVACDKSKTMDLTVYDFPIEE